VDRKELYIASRRSAKESLSVQAVRLLSVPSLKNELIVINRSIQTPKTPAVVAKSTRVYEPRGGER
jgi:hypothetical protein